MPIRDQAPLARLESYAKGSTLPFRPILAAVAAATLLVALTGCAVVSGPPAAHGLSAAAAGPDELGPDDGYIPVGDHVQLTEDVPAVTNLDSRLRDALLSAAQAAAERDVDFSLVDGWRSERYQQYLFDQAVVEYGSEEQASRWVKRPSESKHVQGQAVDIATADAMDWLTRFGAEYGLCQIYANEAWHFELATDENGDCPAHLTDGTAG
jgi:hypothetical protein